MRPHEIVALFLLPGVLSAVSSGSPSSAGGVTPAATRGQNRSGGEESDEDSPPQGEGERPGEPAVSRSALERDFRETMTNVTLEGRWRPVRDGKLGEARDEKYTITGVTKVAGDSWIIFARIQYGDKDVTLPVPVMVKWAGDTPVISVTNAGIPGLGTYTARVLVHGGQYAGTWSGGDHGGVLSGVLRRNESSAR